MVILYLSESHLQFHISWLRRLVIFASFPIMQFLGPTHIPGQNVQPIFGHYTVSNFCLGIWRGKLNHLTSIKISTFKTLHADPISSYFCFAGYSSSNMYQVWTCGGCKLCLACLRSDGYMLPNCLPHREGDYWSSELIVSKLKQDVYALYLKPLDSSKAEVLK